MNWKELEAHVRLIASCKWAAVANPEHINGVDVDCVVKPAPDHWALVEITKEHTLDKLRSDLAKFASVRLFLFGKNIYAECYFVCQDEPPPSLIETGAGMNVKVLSALGFERLFLDYQAYRHLRSERKFGSAVDPESGETDVRTYVEVKYIDAARGESYTTVQLASQLRSGKKIILLGDYGTGKSRCVRELFGELSKQSQDSAIYPLAIDLRDQWGMKRAHEIIQRHTDDLGIGQITVPLMRILDRNVVCLLLDGFDEIGSQAWSDNAARLTQIRMESLRGVNDLISRHRGGVLITGREHYFNSDAEMLQCLGLESSDCLLLRCADEFTEDEMMAYLARDGKDVVLPSWVPKRPLVCQLIAKLDTDELESLQTTETGEAAFWQVFVTALCERERRIHSALDPLTIRRLLRRLARLSRDKAGDVGPISVEEMSASFFAVTGMHPVDESALMLQRLSSLGRVASETSDRCFVDQYILDGLRAEDLSTAEEQDITPLANARWRNPLRRLGITLLASDIASSVEQTQTIRLLKLASQRENSVLAGDIVGAMLFTAESEAFFDGIELRDTHISFLDLSGKQVKGLSIVDSVIDTLDITDCRVAGVEISDCIIQQVYGVSAAGGMPNWIKDCHVEAYESVSTVARIRQAELTEEQRVFVTIIKKLFFQPGKGREEVALLRGLGEAGKKKSADRILLRLMHEGVIDRFKGKEGWVYTPIRKHSSRMGRLMMELTLSKDPLWADLR